MVKFYLIRHAHANWQSEKHRSLSKAGVQDANRVAELLESQQIEALISSPYTRARQTVEPLAARLKLEIQLDDRFKERRLGNWQAGSFEQAVGRTWQDFHFTFPGGESNYQAQTRAKEALEKLIKSGEQQIYAIGTHGNLLAIILNYFDRKIGLDFWSNLSMPDIYELEINNRDLEHYTRVWEERPGWEAKQ